MIDKDIGTVAKFSVRITIVLVLVIAGITISAAFVLYPALRTELTFVTAMIGGLTAIYAAFYSSAATRRQLWQQVLRNSFDMLAMIHDIDVQRIRAALESFPHQDISPAEFYDKITADRDVHVAVRTLLNYFETTSIAIQQEHVDEETMYLSLSWLVPWAASSFHPYIEESRRKAGSATFFIELRKLAGAWESGKFLLTGKAIPKG